MITLFRNTSAWCSKHAAHLRVTPAALFRVVVASTLCILTFGCTTTGLDASYQPKSEDAIIVLGVDGAVKVNITPGRSDEGTWHFVSGFNIKNRPLVLVRDGFVVVRLDQTTGRQRYGVYQVDLGGFGLQGKTATVTMAGVIVIESYVVPYGKAIATFSAESGTVTYVGTIAFEMTNTPPSSVIMKSKWDPEGATNHMSKYYPALAQKLRCLQAVEFQKKGSDRY